MKKRTIHIDGIKLGYKAGVTLLDLVNKEISRLKKNELPKKHIEHIGSSIQEYLAQWNDIQLGDKVEYKPKIIVMKNLFELNKPDPITETEKNSKQLEFNFDFNQDQPLLVELNN